MHRFDVITVGSATQDVFVKTHAELVTVRHQHHAQEMLAYPLGSKILVKELEFQTGGGGTNTATTFARQGLATGFLGKLGDDPASYMIQNFLAKEGIVFLGAKKGQTGYSVILDSEEDDRTILAFKGANNDLRMKDVPKEVSTRWLYCSSMLEQSYETMLAVMRRCGRQGAKVAFNPSSYQAKQGLGTLQRALDHVDVLILNKEEAKLLTGGHGESVEELLHVLRAAGPGIVVITDGARGTHLLHEEQHIHVPAKEGLKVLETTGAGDAFGSGFVAGLARGFPVQKALLLGVLNAEHVIAAYGAKNHILNRQEADTLLRHDRRTLCYLHARCMRTR